MDGWKTLEPVKLYSGSRLLSKSPSGKKITTNAIFHGRLPVDLYDLILLHLPVYDIPQFSRGSRTLARVVKDGVHWEHRWRALGVESHSLAAVLDDVEKDVISKNEEQTKVLDTKSNGPATLKVEDEDDFGDFSVVALNESTTGMFPTPTQNTFGSTPTPTNAFTILAPKSPTVPIPTSTTSNLSLSLRAQFIRAFTLIKKALLPPLSSPPHLILSTLFPPPNPPSIAHQSQTLLLLLLFLSAQSQPIRSWPTLRITLKGAVDRFEAGLLTTFEYAHGKGDEESMKEAAEAGWRVWWAARSGAERERVSAWEIGRVWIEKQEVFYDIGVRDALKNFSQTNSLQFDAMDEFISHLIGIINTNGSLAAKIFPADSSVLLLFADRLANDVVAEYITPLLTRAREISNEIFLQATAAAFVQTWRLVDALCNIASGPSGTPGGVKGKGKEKGTIPITPKKSSKFSETGTGAEGAVARTKIEDVIYRMFEQNMDEYLDEEVELAKFAFETICKEWGKKSAAHSAASNNANSPTPTRFLASSNPAQMKRTVLASFTNALLMPVTIVPRTVGAVGSLVASGGSAAVQGIAMLNPQKWVGGGGSVRSTGTGMGMNGNGYAKGARNEDEVSGSALFIGNDFEDADEDEDVGEGLVMPTDFVPSVGRVSLSSQSTTTLDVPSINSTSTTTRTNDGTTTTTAPSTRATSPNPSTTSTFDHLELLLSLDVALELIHASRDCLKRVETFQGYPGHYGHKVRETIEELFILMLGALGEQHLTPGFSAATEQMRNYRPAEHSETTSVAPLLHFFELVHIGDMIQSMVQVFFDKEMAPHIDRTDFLNAVMREKKRFENTLDDSVAAGLNAGTEVLMNQVEHIIWTQTGPREYYPQEGAPMELGPTKACTEAIACLETHCKLLKGSTSKEVLEVFYQEVGIRLHAILQKHIKRQIISLEGGFQVIADLNAYHSFIASLKVPSITSDFANLKMLGHVYIVSDAVDLAQIVRDVTRYGGAYRPEDIYEFIQRRSDWKKIEKTVDKTMYNLSFKEDCVVC